MVVSGEHGEGQGWGLGGGIHKRADAVDGDAHFVAGLQRELIAGHDAGAGMR